MKTLMIFIVGFVVGSIGLESTLHVVNTGLSKIQIAAKEAAAQ
jgi:1-deoxy-D-xylulose 5-phosphate reductoisomerase